MDSKTTFKFGEDAWKVGQGSGLGLLVNPGKIIGPLARLSHEVRHTLGA